MTIILNKLLGDNCLCYMDDIIVLGTSFKDNSQQPEIRSVNKITGPNSMLLRGIYKILLT